MVFTPLFECCGVTGVLVTILVGLITYVLWDWYRLVSLTKRFNLKGPPLYPLIGNLIQNPGDMYAGELRGKELYGRVYRTCVGSFVVINISDLDILKKIFVKDFQHFHDRVTVKGTEPWPVNRTLLSLQGHDWKRVRSTLTPTFSAGKLKHMVSELNYCANNLTEALLEHAREGKVVDVKDVYGLYTMDVIAGCAFGMRPNSFKNPESQLVTLAKKVFDQDILKNPFMLVLLFAPNLARLLAFFGVSLFYPKDSLHFFIDMIQNIIEERKKTEDSKRQDFLQLMINAESQDENDTKKHLDMDELLGQGFIFFIAGYETTSALLQFASYVLATKPHIQDKLLQEIDDFGDAEPTYDNVTELKYMDLFISECLRMYPPICRMNRAGPVTEDVEIDGHWFPKNVGIQFSIYQIHHDPEYFPDPEEFIPERFTPEGKKNMHPVAFLPFGYGPRNCIGMRLALLEAKIALLHVLRRVKFVSCPETDIPLKMNQETFLRLKSPIRVKVELRL